MGRVQFKGEALTKCRADAAPGHGQSWLWVWR